MSNNYNTLESNKIICEAIDCSSFATEEIEVSAGKFVIPLYVCNICVEKFVQRKDGGDRQS